MDKGEWFSEVAPALERLRAAGWQCPAPMLGRSVGSLFLGDGVVQRFDISYPDTLSNVSEYEELASVVGQLERWLSGDEVNISSLLCAPEDVTEAATQKNQFPVLLINYRQALVYAPGYGLYHSTASDGPQAIIAERADAWRRSVQARRGVGSESTQTSIEADGYWNK